MSDIPVTRGTSRAVTFLIEQPGGSPLDLTGHDVELVIRWRGATDIALARDDGLTVTDGAGSVVWFPSEAETAALPLGRVARWGLEWRAPDGSSEVAGGHLVVTEHPNLD
jgi:hypothetical protein